MYPSTKVLDIFAYSSLFGISISIGLISDLFNILTPHFYCFYIYAVRLYKFWLTCFLSLWYLFFARKINPLFGSRIDSISFSTNCNQRLILGSLIFSIFVWLAPTVIIYYVVFASIRLLSIFLQKFFQFVTELVIHSKPLLILKWMFDPYYFGTEMVKRNNKVRFETLSLSDALMKFSGQTENQTKIFQDLFHGNII